MSFTLFEEVEDDEPQSCQFSSIIEEEEYESETEVSGFEGFKKGFSEEEEDPGPMPRPWDPSEPVWALLDEDQMSCTG